MIKWFKRWRAARAREALIRICREDGHFLAHSGELTPHKMVGGVPVPTGPAEFWLYSCQNKCGYGEVNDPRKAPYRRDFEEGERLKRQHSKEVED